LLGKRVRQAFDDLGDEVIARADGFLGVINKASLNDIPSRAKIGRRVLRKERREGFLRGRFNHSGGIYRHNRPISFVRQWR
jgi:hypothetical protein